MADPWAERIAQLTAEQQQMASQPAAPMYSPEELEKRIAANKRMEAMGALGVMSGDKPMGALGGTYLKRAMENRKQKTTASGVIDPLQGTMKYFPQYTQQRRGEGIQKGLDRAYEQQARASDRKELAAGRRANTAAIAGAITGLGTGSQSPIGMTDKGQPVFRTKDGSSLFTYTKGVPGPYTGPLLSPKDLPAGAARKLGEKESYMQEHDDFSGTFKDSYAGTAPGVGEAEALVGRYVGGPSEEMGNWWQSYRNWTVQMRRDLFGTALTSGEAQMFNQANIQPGMSPSTIRYNLARQKRAMVMQLNNLRRKYPNRYGSELMEVPPAPKLGSGSTGDISIIRPEGPWGKAIGDFYNKMTGDEPAAPTGAPVQPAPQPGAQQPTPAGGGWSIRRKD